MNLYSLRALYTYELGRQWHSLLPNLVSPVISTALYFLVFGSAMGTQVAAMGGISYGAFIVPGLIMLTVLTDAAVTAGFGIFMPKFTGAVYEILSAPISALEITAGFIGATVTKALVLGGLILLTGRLFVPFGITHPIGMLLFFILASAAFGFLGFLLGLWAKDWQKLHSIVTLIIMPLMFLGGTFYSVHTLGAVWRKLALLNPVLYVVNGFRWSFYDTSDISVTVSLSVTIGLLALVSCVTWYVLRRGYGLQS